MNVEAPAPGVRHPRLDQCPYDYVNIYDGDMVLAAHLLGHLCGSSEQVGREFVSRTSRVLIQFKTDDTNEFGGFVLNFQVVDKHLAPAIQAPSMGPQPINLQRCNGAIKTLQATDNEQYIESPNYGLATYDANDHCHWILQADAGKVLQITVVDMELDSGLPTCGGDSVKIYNAVIDVTVANAYNAALVGTMCGPVRLLPEKVLRTTTNGATVSFRSDAFTQYAGFRLSFRQTSPESPLPSTAAPLVNFASPSPCRGRINTLTAEEFQMSSFTSPNYGPGTTSDTCAWLITTNGDNRNNERIRLIVDDFQVGPAGANLACEGNYVRVYDGSSSSAPLMGRFCGDFIYQQMLSSGSSLYIEFGSAANAQGRGFKVSFKAECKLIKLFSNKFFICQFF